MEWQYCDCGRVVDEYENKCFWCGSAKKNIEKTSKKQEDNIKEKQLMFNFGDDNHG